MRSTLGTMVSLMAAILITTAFWQGNQSDPVSRIAFAQDAPETITEAKPTTPPPASPKSNVSVQSYAVTPLRDDLYMHVLAQLKEKTTLTFTDTTLREGIEYVAQLHKIPFIYNNKALQDEGVDLDAVTINYNLTGIPLGTCLDVIFQNQNITYRIWDGIVVIETISSAESQMEVCVYNCRDLLEGVATERDLQSGARQSGGGGGFGGGGGVGGGGGGFFQIDDSINAQYGGGNSNKSTETQKQTHQPPAVGEVTASQMLIKVLTNSVKGPWESVDGSGGTINAFDGMLVVRNNQKAQQGVQNVLEMLRAASPLYRRSPKTTQTQTAVQAPAVIMRQQPEGVFKRESDLDPVPVPQRTEPQKEEKRASDEN